MKVQPDTFDLEGLENLESIIDVPHYVKRYCHERFENQIEFLTERELKNLIRNPNAKVSPIETKLGYTKCFVKRKVLPMTVMRNEMLRYAAELEYRTYAVFDEHRVSLQEARYLLIENYPETNCIAQPISCLNLIKEKRGALKLDLSEVVVLARERRSKMGKVE